MMQLDLEQVTSNTIHPAENPFFYGDDLTMVDNREITDAPDVELEDKRPQHGTRHSPTTESEKLDLEPRPDPLLVEWDGPDDPENPMNMPVLRKWLITAMFSSMTMWVTFSSSVFSSAVTVTAGEFHLSTEVTTLGTSMTVLGFALGPLVWGPMSELYGRLKPLYFGYLLFIIFQIPVGVAQNIQTVLVCRFIIGFFGTSSLSIIGGALVDFWGPVDRAIAISTYSAATFVGPIFGPIVGGFITDSFLGWRWTAWITMIASGFFGAIAFIFVPETYHPTLLKLRAARKRKESGNDGYYALLDKNKPTWGEIVTKYLLRPLQMLAMEPILLAITIYISLVYGILYLFFTAYPFSFRIVRGWSELGLASLPLLGIMVGVLLGCIFVGIATKTLYKRKLEGGKVTPEDRLPPMMIAAVLLPAGLFWFGWTSDPSVPWPAQAVAGVPIGMGILIIWMQGLNYLIDVYLMFANSAISGNSLIRSTIGAVFPLFATYMYKNLGVAWATSLLAFLGVAMIPIPVVFYMYGSRIRALSRFSPKL